MKNGIITLLIGLNFLVSLHLLSEYNPGGTLKYIFALMAFGLSFSTWILATKK